MFFFKTCVSLDFYLWTIASISLSQGCLRSIGTVRVFSRLSLPVERAVYSANVLFFLHNFSGPTSHLVISETTELIFTKFSGLVVPWECFIKRSSILRSLRDVAMATNFVAEFAKLAHPNLVRHAGISKRIAGSQFQFQRSKGQLFSTSSKNLVRFSPVIPQSLRGYNVYSRRRSLLGLVSLRSLGGDTAKHCVDQWSGLFYYCSQRETLLDRAGYILGFATHC